MDEQATCAWKHCTNTAPMGTRGLKLYCSDKCKNKGAVDKRRRDVKLKAVMLKGGACETCGYNRIPWVLQFHHRDPSQKEFGIGSGNTIAWERVAAEIDKCDLLCPTCHAEHHHLEHHTPQ